MQKVTYVNAIGESITFEAKRPFLLFSLDGFDSVETDLKSSKGFNQDGESYINTTLDKRQLVIGFNLLCSSREDVVAMRDKAMRVFNPKLKEGYLYYSYAGLERKIKCKPDKSPVMKNTSKLDTTGEVILIAHDPYFTDLNESVEELNSWVGGLNFPLNLPTNFKTKGESKKNLYNDGHVNSPITIVFKGPAINPKVTNITTGEFIEVNRELTSEDTLYITTGYQNKTVVIERNGIKENAFNYINLNSTFFSLVIGDNLIEYSTESLEPRGVEIRYNKKYLGV